MCVRRVRIAARLDGHPVCHIARTVAIRAVLREQVVHCGHRMQAVHDWAADWVHGFFQHMKNICILTPYDAQGIDTMGNQGVLFCVAIGLVAYLPEAFLGGVLCDNRAALRRDDLQESVLLEWQFLEHLPPSFWRSLAPLVDLCPAALRNMVIKGAAVAWSYLEWRVVSALWDLPWSLCCGDLDDNLSALADMEGPPLEPVAANIWSLLKVKYERKAMLAALELLSTASFTSTFAEKQHASTSQVEKIPPRGER